MATILPESRQQSKPFQLESPRMDLKTLEVWFVTGSQHLYGEAALRQVAENSRRVVEGLNASGRLPVRVVFKPVVTTPQSILRSLPRGQRGGQLCRA